MNTPDFCKYHLSFRVNYLLIMVNLLRLWNKKNNLIPPLLIFAIITVSFTLKDDRQRDAGSSKGVAIPAKVVGRWYRADGGYTIEIIKINLDNTLDTAYFNPKPIHIGRAMLLNDREQIKIFIELRDKGYPGSTYTLNYDAEHDILKGIYFHAGLNKSFDVLFSRIE